MNDLAQMLRKAPDASPFGAQFILRDLATAIPRGTARLNSGSLAYATPGLDMFYSLEHFKEHADGAIAIAEATLRAKGYDTKLEVAYETAKDYQDKTYWNAHIRLTSPASQTSKEAAHCG